MVLVLPKPPLALTIVFHETSTAARAIAETLFKTYRRDPSVDGPNGFGLPISFRALGATDVRPPSIEVAEKQAVVVLLDSALAEACDALGSSLEQEIGQIADQTLEDPERMLLRPVALSKQGFELWRRFRSEVNALKLYPQTEDPPADQADLLSLRLSHALAVLMRGGALTASGKPEPIRIFLSHTQEDGRAVTEAIRTEIQAHPNFADFYYPVDCPEGYDFSDILVKELDRCAMIVVQTDTYSSREWCRWEVIEAKRRGAPIVVANAVEKGEARSFPYLGNVPVVGFDPSAPRHHARSARTLLRATVDEILRHELWKGQQGTLKDQLGSADGTHIFATRPPEILSIMFENERMGQMPDVIIHPDPPLGMLEADLIRMMNKEVQLLTPSEIISGK